MDTIILHLQIWKGVKGKNGKRRLKILNWTKGRVGTHLKGLLITNTLLKFQVVTLPFKMPLKCRNFMHLVLSRINCVEVAWIWFFVCVCVCVCVYVILYVWLCVCVWVGGYACVRVRVYGSFGRMIVRCIWRVTV